MLPGLRRLLNDQKLRLFQQLHQDDDPEYYRASGSCKCPICGLEYRDHPEDPIYDIDHRLCNGDIVHL